MNIENAIPLAYFITFTTYGTWLHGAKEKGSVDRFHNTPGTPFLPFDSTRKQLVEKQMRYPPYLLDACRRKCILDTIKSESEYRQWDLLAAHVRTNHVHIVIHATCAPEIIMSTFKSYASRHLRMSGLDNGNPKRWTRHGSTRYLWKPEQVEATIHYVVNEQGDSMAVFENIERLLKFYERQNVSPLAGAHVLIHKLFSPPEAKGFPC